jgi:hypothetical protein
MRKHNKIFVHIPKTAGTSFMDVINENEGDFINCKGLMSIIKSVIQDGDFVKGHIPYGVNVFGFSQPRYITFLRNPTEQCISFYYFVQEWHKHPYYHDAKRNSLIDFYSMNTYQNPQTKYIGGHVLLPNDYMLINYLLRRAKQRLTSKFDFGITERYADSIKLLCSRFHWDKSPITHTTRAKLRPKTEDISKDILDTLKELNVADWDLYHYALTLFSERCRQAGIELTCG